MNTSSERLLSILEQLTAFPTVSDQSNLELIEYVRALTDSAASMVHQLDDSKARKASLLLRFGPDAPGGILLSGHTDVVPADGDGWDSPPFTLTTRDDRLYGRGVADMKGFIAAALTAALQHHEAAAAGSVAALQRPIYLALTYDEEVGCLAAPSLIASFRDQVAPIEAAIIGEPTMMQPVLANKGISEYITDFFGRSAHSSKPHLGINAIELAHRYMNRILELATEFRRSGADNSCIPPYTTVQIGTIHGGSATNIVPDHCRISCDLRCFHDRDRQYFEQELAAARTLLLAEFKLDQSSMRTTITCTVPPLEPRPDSAALRLAAGLTGITEPLWVPYATEAGQYQQAGYEAVILGPGSIEQAHQNNEWIALDQLEDCLKLLQQLFSRQSTPATK